MTQRKALLKAILINNTKLKENEKQEIETQITHIRELNVEILNTVNGISTQDPAYIALLEDYHNNLGYIQGLKWVLYSPLRNG